MSVLREIKGGAAEDDARPANNLSCLRSARQPAGVPVRSRRRPTPLSLSKVSSEPN